MGQKNPTTNEPYSISELVSLYSGQTAEKNAECSQYGRSDEDEKQAQRGCESREYFNAC